MLLVHCWARLCGGDLEVKAFNCKAMVGMWLVTRQECGMADTYSSGSQTLVAMMLKRYISKQNPQQNM